MPRTGAVSRPSRPSQAVSPPARPPQPKRLALQRFGFFCEFLNLDEPIPGDAGKVLARIAGRPPDLQVLDVRRFAQPDVLFQRRRSERSTAPDRSVDRSRRGTFIPHRYFDPGTDGGAIGFHARQPDVDPVVPVARVFEEPRRLLVSLSRPAHHHKEIFVAVAIEIGKRHAVSLGKYPRSRRRRNV